MNQSRGPWNLIFAGKISRFLLKSDLDFWDGACSHAVSQARRLSGDGRGDLSYGSGGSHAGFWEWSSREEGDRQCFGSNMWFKISLRADWLADSSSSYFIPLYLAGTGPRCVGKKMKKKKILARSHWKGNDLKKGRRVPEGLGQVRIWHFRNWPCRSDLSLIRLPIFGTARRIFLAQRPHRLYSVHLYCFWIFPIHWKKDCSTVPWFSLCQSHEGHNENKGRGKMWNEFSSISFFCRLQIDLLSWRIEGNHFHKCRCHNCFIIDLHDFWESTELQKVERKYYLKLSKNLFSFGYDTTFANSSGHVLVAIAYKVVFALGKRRNRDLRMQQGHRHTHEHRQATMCVTASTCKMRGIHMLVCRSN